jgi:MoaA/NifB/PqqE/SkfB family radical SAM enzyme
MYPRYWEVLTKAREKNLHSTTFTNGTLIDKNIARELYSRGEDVALKFNAMDEDIQDRLAGNIQGTGRKIKQTLEYLLEAGYSGKEGAPRLALETIVCRQNYDEIFPIYRFCRENNLTPYVEILNVQGNAKKNKDTLVISPSEAYELFKTLKEYDENEWGITWPLTPPIAGQTCKRMYYSAYITATGEVQPCPGVDISSGNIKEQKLRTIISESKIFSDVRYTGRNVEDPCRTCYFAEHFKCYGCRGAALQLSGSHLDGDPTCWWIR